MIEKFLCEFLYLILSIFVFFFLIIGLWKKCLIYNFSTLILLFQTLLKVYTWINFSFVKLGPSKFFYLEKCSRNFVLVEKLFWFDFLGFTTLVKFIWSRKKALIINVVDENRAIIVKPIARKGSNDRPKER